jgi:uncharacterized metal-binding protein (TIGR02443 family)
MPVTTARRRFIAGAVCPRCARMDKIVVNLDTDRRECVACGFSEERPDSGAGGNTRSSQAVSMTELPTRVSRAAARRVETPAEPVRLLDPEECGKA